MLEWKTLSSQSDLLPFHREINKYQFVPFAFTGTSDTPRRSSRRSLAPQFQTAEGNSDTPKTPANFRNKLRTREFDIIKLLNLILKTWSALHENWILKQLFSTKFASFLGMVEAHYNTDFENDTSFKYLFDVNPWNTARYIFKK